ncbi:MAG: hypothetical protein HYV60_00690, partial [Planctomycetia bacterium]|nr:hypothetical protein [Planctomycetia bacterium]
IRSEPVPFFHSLGAFSRVSFTVVLGNPPFRGISSNPSSWIGKLLRGTAPGDRPAASYYEVDGEPLRERKLWLQDDYVKFMRYAQWQIERTGVGVLGFVTNHGYLDNATFRGMRQAAATRGCLILNRAWRSGSFRGPVRTRRHV